MSTPTSYRRHKFSLAAALTLSVLIFHQFISIQSPFTDQKEDYRECPRDLILQPFINHHPTDNNNSRMFFLETSGRNVLNPRQACAVESASRFSGLDEIVVMVKSDFISLKDKVMCRLTTSLKNVKFHKIVPALDFSGTPLSDFYRNGGFNSSKFPSTHLSDALRMAYVYKYGGWYADVDYLFLRPLRNLSGSNVFCGVAGEGEDEDLWLTNSIFGTDKPGSEVARKYLEGVRDTFKGESRLEVGPLFLTKTFRQHCGLKDEDMLSNVSCDGISVLGPDVFNPVRPGSEKTHLWRKEKVKSFKVWDDLFANSRGIHFFSFVSNQLPVNDPSRHAYAYLGPKYCPASFHGSTTFRGDYVL